MPAHVALSSAADTDLLAVALAVLGGGLAMLIVVTLLADRRGLLPHAAVPFGRWVAMIVAGLSVGAASIHFAVIGAHFAEYPPYGVAFAALAWFQVGWALAYLLVPDRRLAIAAIVVNAGTLAVWVVSRTVGLPIGPEIGEIEPVGPLDVAAGIMEVALVAVLAWDLGAIGRRTRPSLPRAGAVIALGSVALVVILLTTAAFAAAGGDAHGGADHDLPPIGAVEAPAASPSPFEPGQPSPSDGGTEPTAASASPFSSASPAAVSSESGPPTPSSAFRGSPVPSGAGPTASNAPEPTVAPSPSATRSPQPTASRATPTPRPATPPPTKSPGSPASVTPGVIRFGTSLGPNGEIATPTTEFGEGQSAVWVADFTRAPNATTVRMFIVEILTDGREFEHWREDIVVDPAARRFVGRADLSLYLHGGAGRHVMRYMQGDALLAEGSFTLVR